MNTESALSWVNLSILVLCQFVSVTGTVLVITIGGIVGTELATDPSFATLPMSIMVVGTAIGTIPAALLMQRVGRRWGFAVGLLIGGASMLVMAWALEQLSFAWFCLGAAALGVSLGFSQQFRFAAAEAVSVERASQAIAIVLLGSIGGALAGPALATFGEGNLNSFVPALMLAAGGYAIGILLVQGLRIAPVLAAAFEEPRAPRPLRQMAGQPLLLVAVLGGVVAQGVMTLIMTATPISMHVHQGYSLDATADVISMHVLAMYVPALFSGVLIARLGVTPVMAAGAGLMLLSVFVGLLGHEYLHYSGSMIALGVAWNFLFVGGTTLLVRTHRPEERFRAQAFNDFSVFGASALASLGAGALLTVVGWDGVLWVGLVPTLLVLLALALTRNGIRRSEAVV